MITHTIKSYWISSQSYKFKEFAKISNFWILKHTFWSCLINMKWMRRVLLKIQSGHDSVHRRTEGKTDKVKPVYPSFNFVEAEGITIIRLHWYATAGAGVMGLWVSIFTLKSRVFTCTQTYKWNVNDKCIHLYRTLVYVCYHHKNLWSQD